jgi:hypothetical protein
MQHSQENTNTDAKKDALAIPRKAAITAERDDLI